MILYFVREGSCRGGGGEKTMFFSAARCLQRPTDIWVKGHKVSEKSNPRDTLETTSALLLY